MATEAIGPVVLVVDDEPAIGFLYTIAELTSTVRVPAGGVVSRR